MGRGSGKLRAALSVQLAWAFLLWGASPHTPLPACACRARYPYKLGTSLIQQQTTTTRCKIPEPSLITHQLKEHSSPHFYEAWIYGMYGTFCYGWYGMYGMVWYGMVWYGMVWYGMAISYVWYVPTMYQQQQTKHRYHKYVTYK